MLSKDEVKHIALLARMGLTDAEVEKFQRDLSTVIDWFEELKEADVTGVSLETSMAPETNQAAEDVSRASGENEQILANAPDKKDKYLKVRSVF